MKADQYKKQLYRAEEDRRQALATSEALTALWHKRFEKARLENGDLKQELLSAHDRISLLQDRLAIERIHTRNLPPPTRSVSSHDVDSVAAYPPQRSVASTLKYGSIEPREDYKFMGLYSLTPGVVNLLVPGFCNCKPFLLVVRS